MRSRPDSRRRVTRACVGPAWRAVLARVSATTRVAACAVGAGRPSAIAAAWEVPTSAPMCASASSSTATPVRRALPISSRRFSARLLTGPAAGASPAGITASAPGVGGLFSSRRTASMRRNASVASREAVSTSSSAVRSPSGVVSRRWATAQRTVMAPRLPETASCSSRAMTRRSSATARAAVSWVRRRSWARRSRRRSHREAATSPAMTSSTVIWARREGSGE